MKHMLLAICTIGVGSCATPVTPFRAMASEQALGTTNETVFERSYTIGETRTATVGEQVVGVRQMQARYTQHFRLSPTSDFTLTDGQTTVTFTRGVQFDVTRGIRIKDEVLAVVGRPPLGILVHDNGAISETVASYVTGRPELLPSTFVPSDPAALFERVELERAEVSRIPAPDGQNFDIIYNGNDGAAMRFTYREFTPDNFARPAFFQDLSYPMRSRDIRFRDLRLSISNVDASSITFTVEADGLTSTP